jgi:hypothetical protein
MLRAQAPKIVLQHYLPEADITPPHSIASLARNKIDVGITMPNAPAARKLIAMSPPAKVDDLPET